MFYIVQNSYITFYEMETLENDPWDGSLCSLQPHPSAHGTWGWSECRFTNGWDFHHKHPSRVCHFPVKMGPIDRSIFTTALQQMFTHCVLAAVYWPSRYWPNAWGSPQSLQVGSTACGNHGDFGTTSKAAQGTNGGDVNSVQSRCSVVTGENKCFINVSSLLKF